MKVNVRPSIMPSKTLEANKHIKCERFRVDGRGLGIGAKRPPRARHRSAQRVLLLRFRRQSVQEPLELFPGHPYLSGDCAYEAGPDLLVARYRNGLAFLLEDDVAASLAYRAETEPVECLGDLSPGAEPGHFRRLLRLSSSGSSSVLPRCLP